MERRRLVGVGGQGSGIKGIYTAAGCSSLVEHDGLWVLVHHLGHVSQDVLLGDDAQETPEDTREVRGHTRSFSSQN